MKEEEEEERLDLSCLHLRDPVGGDHIQAATADMSEGLIHRLKLSLRSPTLPSPLSERRDVLVHSFIHATRNE